MSEKHSAVLHHVHLTPTALYTCINVTPFPSSSSSSPPLSAPLPDTVIRQSSSASATSLSIAPNLSKVPIELVQIILRFLFPSIAPLVRVNRVVWERLRTDRLTWTELARRRQSSRRGRAMIRPIADRFIDWCPELNRCFPRTVARQVHQYAVSPDGKYLACGEGREMQIYDIGTSEQIAAGTLEERLYQLCFSALPSLLACAEGYKISLFDCTSWDLIMTFAREGCFWWSLCFLPEGSLVSGSLGGEICIWDAQADSPRVSMSSHQGVFALAASNTLLASGHEQGLLQLWTLNGERARRLEGHSLTVRDLVFAPDDIRLVSAGDDDTARVWDSHTGECLFLIDPHSGPVTSVDVSKQGLLAVAFKDVCEIRFWHLNGTQVNNVLGVDNPQRVRFAAHERGDASLEIYVLALHGLGTLEKFIV